MPNITLDPLARLASRSRAMAIVVVLCTVLAACSSSSGGLGGSGSTAQGSPGVTATTVRMGFIIPDSGSLSSRLGFKTIDPGTIESRTAAINAIVDYINQNGGVGGRQLVPVIKTYTLLEDSAATAEALCRQFTQDEQVFAISLAAQLQNNARPCYQQGRAIMIDSALPQDQTAYEKYGGYLWSASSPEYGAFMRTQIRTLSQAGFFAGATGVMLLTSDDEVSRRVSEGITKPELRAVGVSNIHEAFIDGSNLGTLGTTVGAAQVKGTTAGTNRAIAVGGARILPLALSGFEASAFEATWSVTTLDNPFNLESNRETYVADRYPGMLGIGFSSLADTRDPAVPFPDPALSGQVRCKQIVDANPASTPPKGQPASYSDAFRTCDAAFFVKAVLDTAPRELTVESFRQAAFALTDEFQPTSAVSARGGPNVYALVNAARPMAWDVARNLFVYTGGAIPLDAY